MRILHADASPSWGGQGFRILEQVDWLNRNGFFAALAVPSNSDIYEHARASGVPTYALRFERYSLPTILQAQDLIRRERFDLVDCHGRWAARVFAYCRNLCVVVRTRHTSKRPKARWSNRLRWRLGCHHVIVTASCIRSHIIDAHLVDEGRVSVVGEWADERFFDLSQRNEHRDSVRVEFGIPEGEPLVLSIGMLRPDKGQEHLITTAALLRDRGVAARYLVVGAANHRKPESRYYEAKLHRMRDQLKLRDRVIFAGYRDDTARLIQAADCQVITSTDVEAQSRAVPQAFASMTPVVASRIGGVSELVTPGKTGWLVPIGDSPGYAAALREIFGGGERVEGIRREARAYAKGVLTIDNKMSQTCDVYRTLVARRATTGIASA